MSFEPPSDMQLLCAAFSCTGNAQLNIVEVCQHGCCVSIIKAWPVSQTSASTDRIRCQDVFEIRLETRDMKIGEGDAVFSIPDLIHF